MRNLRTDRSQHSANLDTCSSWWASSQRTVERSTTSGSLSQPKFSNLATWCQMIATLIKQLECKLQHFCWTVAQLLKTRVKIGSTTKIQLLLTNGNTKRCKVQTVTTLSESTRFGVSRATSLVSKTEWKWRFQLSWEYSIWLLVSWWKEPTLCTTVTGLTSSLKSSSVSSFSTDFSAGWILWSLLSGSCPSISRTPTWMINLANSQCFPTIFRMELPFMIEVFPPLQKPQQVQVILLHQIPIH